MMEMGIASTEAVAYKIHAAYNDRRQDGNRLPDWQFGRGRKR